MDKPTPAIYVAGHRAVRRVKRRAAREGAPRGSECVGRGAALGPGVAGPPRRVRTAVYGAYGATRTWRARARETSRRTRSCMTVSV
jgi:hypothetical protein